MGNKFPVELKNITKFPEETIKAMQIEFKRDHPSGVITYDTFRNRYKEIFLTGGNTRDFARMVFDAYDKDGNGTIDFKEYMIAKNIIINGTVKDKLDWAFEMLYDRNGDGKVTRAEARSILSVSFNSC